jgi:hypothetical protein
VRRAWEGLIAAVGAALCTIGLHAAPTDRDPALVVYWDCQRCGATRDGGRAPRKRRRKR